MQKEAEPKLCFSEYPALLPCILPYTEIFAMHIAKTALTCINSKSGIRFLITWSKIR